MTDTTTLITVCEAVKQIDFDRLTKGLMEANVAYSLVPSDKHKEKLLVAASTLLLKNLLTHQSVAEIVKKMELLDLLTLKHN